MLEYPDIALKFVIATSLTYFTYKYIWCKHFGVK